MVEITATEQNKEKRMKTNEDNQDYASQEGFHSDSTEKSKALQTSNS